MKEKGVAIFLAVVLILFLMPLTFTLVYVTRQHQKSSYQEKQLKSARILADNAIVDYMRSFSQNYYADHYDTDKLARPQSFYKVGFTEVSVIPDTLNHFIYIEATGKYGKSATNPLFRKTLYSVIQFVSPWTDFGTMIDSNFTISASNVTYYGKFWINGNLYITGWNVRFVGGPIFVSGNLYGSSSVIIDGDLYYGGSSAGSVTVNGTKYNFMPSLTFPTIDTTYYAEHYNYKITSNSKIIFNSNGTFTVVGSTTIAIPEEGIIIYGQNCSLQIKGTVKGRVTICASGSGSKGKITVYGNLTYANGTNYASESDSIAVLATNRIIFKKYGSNLTVCGVFQSSSSNYFLMQGSWGRTFRLYGTRNKGISVSPWYSFSGGRYLYFDPNLSKYPPPGLPEKPYLVTWHIK